MLKNQFLLCNGNTKNVSCMDNFKIYAIFQLR